MKLVRVFREEVLAAKTRRGYAATKRLFTAKTQSSQRSEYFLIKKSFLRALRASAVNPLLIP